MGRPQLTSRCQVVDVAVPVIEKRWLRTLRCAGASLTPGQRRYTTRIGRRAERRAERLLRRHGLRTLARNYTRRTGEIDLVMLDGDVLAFVEVRYRSPGAWTTGLGSVDGAKKRRLTRTAERYLAEHPEHRYRGIRFDVVAASKGNYGIACEWIQDAFDAMDG